MQKKLFLARTHNVLRLRSYFDQFLASLSDRLPIEQRRKKLVAHNSVASIEERSRALLEDLKQARSEETQLMWLDALLSHMSSMPLSRNQVRKRKGVSHLLKVRDGAKNERLAEKSRIALAMLGYVDPVQAHGVRILSLDGGGTRGVMSIEMLKQISRLCDRPIHNLFDIIVGTSTGAILAFLLGVKKASLRECEALYEQLSEEIFHANRLYAASKLFLQHSYYSSATLEKLFKHQVGESKTLIETSGQTCPKVVAVASLVNRPVLQPYVFRNYSPACEHHAITGSSCVPMYQALLATTAAPGYFDEVIIKGDVFQDGGLLTNNPCALAIHEAKMLWPDTPIQTIVSIGTGTYHGQSSPHTTQFSTLKEKLDKLVASATDVEAIHYIIEDMLPPSQYIRLNPNMSQNVPLDESSPHQLQQLRQDTRNYIDKFSHKFDCAAVSLVRHKSLAARIKDNIELSCQKQGWM